MLQHSKFLWLTLGLMVLAGVALFFVRHFISPVESKVAATEFLYKVNSASDTFSQPAPALNATQLQTFNLGNRIFNTAWVPIPLQDPIQITAPKAARAFTGLGPLYNHASCAACHERDGRGQPPGDAQRPLSMLIRVSIAGNSAHGAPNPVPGYGLQINDQAIPGVADEARVALVWQEITGAYGDGEKFILRAPSVTLGDTAYGALPKNMLTSIRVAPAVFGSA